MKYFFLSRRTLLLATIFWALGFAVQAQPTMKEGYIEVPGGKVWYKILGADKPGIPLLLLHGGPGSGSGSFEGFVALADERPVILYDQLGCGKSDKPDNPQLWTMERFVTELEQVIAALGYSKLHLLGHSWGGTLATEYLLTKKPPPSSA
ncbi:alpha/beta fold hydrolase [Hymenobacter radiodurans]|uniref:alpha/beta fold hydrolase n=1 Tax=Hymenobacter radiodurans TaxID=2496028 RepID=UPI001058FCF7|nr:alpha/beta fold hydrolase [Hymenobacter radiodurans]